MTPYLITNDLSSCSPGNAKHFAKLVLVECASGVQSPDFDNLRFVELGLWQHLAMCATAFGAAFEPHIFNVLVVRANPDMQGIHAFSIVARMAGKMAFWYWAMSKFVAQAMRQDGLALNPNLTVSVGIKSGFPFPAIIRAALVNFAPKAFVKCFHRCNYSIFDTRFERIYLS